MYIHGLQKMTLLDFPGKVACTVFLGGCDMRCPFCHNWELVDMSAQAVMDDTELISFLEGRVGLLDGVAFTGGEPLMRKDLAEVMKKIRDMGFLIKLDTNGNHPDELKKILEEGLVDYVAMDVKNSPERYGETIGLPGFDISRIRESIEYLISNGKSQDDAAGFDYEFRTTVVKQFHNEDSFKGIAQLIKGAGRYYLQEFVDRETVPYAGLEGCTKEEMNRFLDIVAPYVKNAEIRGV
ncbi:MAG TPA: anaerobic ribonucleoside-triphosphate reductase activating protein [Lachnospiraceae bacterium]|nr:anaerobic ribonucleoside-triphosphate reductase activating protein [Eubacterium sp.]HBZ02571.1 anaerobic ribonucleoside-triphosphate reductase activating protein [Lachnospiraceae bacterium]